MTPYVICHWIVSSAEAKCSFFKRKICNLWFSTSLTGMGKFCSVSNCITSCKLHHAHQKLVKLSKTLYQRENTGYHVDSSRHRSRAAIRSYPEGSFPLQISVVVVLIVRSKPTFSSTYKRDFESRFSSYSFTSQNRWLPWILKVQGVLDVVN